MNPMGIFKKKDNNQSKRLSYGKIQQRVFDKENEDIYELPDENINSISNSFSVKQCKNDNLNIEFKNTHKQSNLFEGIDDLIEFKSRIDNQKIEIEEGKQISNSKLRNSLEMIKNKHNKYRQSILNNKEKYLTLNMEEFGSRQSVCQRESVQDNNNNFAQNQMQKQSKISLQETSSNNNNNNKSIFNFFENSLNFQNNPQEQEQQQPEIQQQQSQQQHNKCQDLNLFNFPSNQKFIWDNSSVLQPSNQIFQTQNLSEHLQKQQHFEENLLQKIELSEKKVFETIKKNNTNIKKQNENIQQYDQKLIIQQIQNLQVNSDLKSELANDLFDIQNTFNQDMPVIKEEMKQDNMETFLKQQIQALNSEIENVQLQKQQIQDIYIVSSKKKEDLEGQVIQVEDEKVELQQIIDEQLQKPKFTQIQQFFEQEQKFRLINEPVANKNHNGHYKQFSFDLYFHEYTNFSIKIIIIQENKHSSQQINKIYIEQALDNNFLKRIQQKNSLKQYNFIQIARHILNEKFLNQNINIQTEIFKICCQIKQTLNKIHQLKQQVEEVDMIYNILIDIDLENSQLITYFILDNHQFKMVKITYCLVKEYFVIDLEFESDIALGFFKKRVKNQQFNSFNELNNVYSYCQTLNKMINTNFNKLNSHNCRLIEIIQKINVCCE